MFRSLEKLLKVSQPQLQHCSRVWLIKALLKCLLHFESVKKCNNSRLLCGFSYNHTLNYTESNCIRVVGGCKMPLYWAKHEYIQSCLYILSLTSCNGITPVTLSPTRLLYSLKFELMGARNYLPGEC